MVARLQYRPEGDAAFPCAFVQAGSLAIVVAVWLEERRFFFINGAIPVKVVMLVLSVSKAVLHRLITSGGDQ